MSIIKTIENTYTNQKVISPSIMQIEFGEHSILKIDHSKCKAAISLQGAHLLYWQPTSEASPVIWLSQKAEFKKMHAIRGGVPICWPWFSNRSTPSHGFARIVDWQLQSYQESENQITLVFSLDDNAQTKPYWKHAFHLELKIVLSETCGIELSCQGDFEATSALHTYFNVSHIENVTIKGLGKYYNDHLTAENRIDTTEKIQFNQEVDRCYTKPESVVTIEDKQRKIQLTNYHHSDIVAWNSWIDKTKTIADLDDESYKQFVCVETARITKPIKSTAEHTTHYGVIIEAMNNKITEITNG